MKPTAVVLVSGGLDSCVTAAIAAQEYECAFLHLNYGQLTEQREAAAFHALADHFEVSDRLIIDTAHFTQIGGSSLTDPALPVTEADLESDDIPTSYVPFRNANILSMATSWAEAMGARKIFIGAVAEDASGYPDCRPEFFEAFNRLIETGTKPETAIRIETPIIHFRKKEIIRQETG